MGPDRHICTVNSVLTYVALILSKIGRDSFIIFNLTYLLVYLSSDGRQF